eukprot:PITA_31419
MGSAQGQGQGQDVLPTSFKPKIKKGLWSPEEDNKLTNYILRNGLTGCWSYVAEQAGRTDNEIKNHWNSAIKKKLKSKPPTSSSPTVTNCNTDTESMNPSQSNGICRTDSVFSHADDAFTSFDAAQPYLDDICEDYQACHHSPAYNTVNVLTIAENPFYLPGVLELENEQEQNENPTFSTDRDPTPTCSPLIASAHNHDGLPTHTSMCTTLQPQSQTNYETAKSASKEKDSCTPSTLQLLQGAEAASLYHSPCYSITVPDLIGSELMKENFANNFDAEIFAQNEIMIDYSQLTASSGISGWSASHCYSNITADCAHVVDPGAYIDIYSSYQLTHLDGGGGAGDQFTNSIPKVAGGSEELMTECKGGAGQDTVWELDYIYN